MVSVSMAYITKVASLVLLVSDDADAIGRGCFGASLLSKVGTFETTIASTVDALCGRRCWLVEEDVLPG